MATVTSDAVCHLTVNKKSLDSYITVCRQSIYDGSPVTGTVSLGTVSGLARNRDVSVISPSATVTMLIQMQVLVKHQRYHILLLMELMGV